MAASRFDDTAKRHKPAPETYAEVTQTLGAPPSEMCMARGGDVAANKALMPS